MPGKRLRLLGVADGRSINVHRWARRLVDRGHEVAIVSSRLPPGGQTAEGVPVHDVRSLGGLTGVPLFRRGAIAPAIGRLAARLEVDLVHAHYLLPYGYWAARAGRHPLVMSPWSRDVFVDANESRQGRRRAVEAIAASDYLVVNSEREPAAPRSTSAPTRSGSPQIIWYSENDRFSPARADRGLRARLGWPEDALVVLSLRNYRPYTNLDVVIRAFARAARDEPRARLLLAARGGPTRSELEALVDELGIRPLVAFERVEWEDLPGVAAAADVAITIAELGLDTGLAARGDGVGRARRRGADVVDRRVDRARRGWRAGRVPGRGCRGRGLAELLATPT